MKFFGSILCGIWTVAVDFEHSPPSGKALKE